MSAPMMPLVSGMGGTIQTRFARMVSTLGEVVAICLLAGCAGSPNGGDSQPRVWPAGDSPPALSDFARSIVGAGDLSVYVTHVDLASPDPPERRHLGGYGLGNGTVFALVGLSFPMNALHNAIGPGYQKENRFFGDHALVLRDTATGAEIPFREEWAMQVRRTAITVTLARANGVLLETIDLAPWTSAPDSPERRAILRIAVVRANGDGSAPAAVDVVERATLPVRSGDGWIEEANGSRVMRVLFLDGEGESKGGDLVRRIAPLRDGNEIVLPMTYLFADSAAAPDQIAETLDALRSRGPEAIVRETRGRWLDYLSSAAEIETPDRRVNDLAWGMLVTLKVQQAASGASTPMSQYSRSWLRDLIGPIRYWLDVGDFADVRAALDYQYAAALFDGDVKNSVPVDRDPSRAPAPPDWESLPPLDGTVAAESPSYQILAYHGLYRATGDIAPIRERWGFLRRCLEGQEVNDLGLLPFSGDETYRTAMSVGLGMDPTYPFERLAYSAGSSFLFVTAAEAMAEMATAVGDEARAGAYRARSAQVREATEKHYLLPSGFYSPFLSRDDLFAEQRPFEDVNLAPLWAGYSSPDDDDALRNLDETLARIGRDDGTIQTPLPLIYRGFVNLLGIQIREGIFTGMVPGYLLYNLAVADHPMADAAFDALGRTVMSSGNWAEYMIHDDFSALSIHDPTGAIANYTARYRPWEGGINLDALFAFLVAAAPDAASGTVRLAPRLPDDWPRFEARGLRVGDTRYDLAVQAPSGSRARTYRIENHGPDALAFDLVIRAGERTVGSIELEGSRVDTEVLPIRTRYGRTSITLPGIALPARSHKTVRVLWAD